jgi:hypothetical protein
VAGEVYTATVTLTAASGYTFDGLGEDAFSHDGATAVTNTEDSGLVTIVFSGAEDGIVIGEPVSADKLAAYLAKLPEGSPENPSTVVLETFDVSSNTWGTTIKAALAGSNKYIVLDLSDCTATDDTISGNGDNPSGNHFNVINTAYIAGIIFPDTLVTIEGACNSSFPNLKSVVMSDSVTTIGDFTFYNCSGITSVTLSAGLTSIGDGAFNKCSITSVTLPAGLTSIGSQAFQATGLTSVTIPAGVKTIKNYTFNNCSSLTSVTLLRSSIVTLEDTSAFTNTNAALEIFVPTDLVDSYKAATNWTTYADRIKAIVE